MKHHPLHSPTKPRQKLSSKPKHNQINIPKFDFPLSTKDQNNPSNSDISSIDDLQDINIKDEDYENISLQDQADNDEEDKELQQLMQQGGGEVAELQAKMGSVNAELKIANYNLKEKLRLLQQKKGASRTQISIQEMESKIFNLEQMLDSSQSVNNQLKEDLKHERQQKGRLKIENQTLKLELQTRNHQIQTMISSKITVDEQATTIQELQKAIQDQKEKYKKLKFHCQNLEKTNKKLKQTRDLNQSGFSQSNQFLDQFNKVNNSEVWDTPPINQAEGGVSLRHISSSSVLDSNAGRKQNPLIVSRISPQHSGRYESYSQQYQREKLQAQKEYEKLKQALSQEQTQKIEQGKDIMELQTRLKIAMEQVQESKQTRAVLVQEIKRMDKQLTFMASKIKDSEQLSELCSKFLQQNGIVVTSFISDDMFQI